MFAAVISLNRGTDQPRGVTYNWRRVYEHSATVTSWTGTYRYLIMNMVTWAQIRCTSGVYLFYTTVKHVTTWGAWGTYRNEQCEYY